MPRPWPKITAKTKNLGMGELEFERNGQTLNFQQQYEIEVEPGDSLSKYSMILYGNFKQIDAFVRPKTPNGYVYDVSDTIPIANPNQIRAGELLYHLPMIEENNSPGARQAGGGYRDLPEGTTPNVTLPAGIEIIAYDNYDSTGGLEHWTTFGTKAEFTNVRSFVNNVIVAAGGKKIKLLHIQAHGDPNGVYFGDCGQSIPGYRYPFSAAPPGDYVRTGGFAPYRADFMRLQPYFAKGAWVVFRSCETGWAQSLLREFRTVWGVNILAGKGNWNNFYDTNTGSFVIYEIGGKEYRTSTLPWALQHDTLRANGVRDNPMY